MAIANNDLLKNCSGKIGDLVVRQRNGKTIVSRKPQKRRSKTTPEQLEKRKRFRAATAYAKAVMKDDALKEAYKAKCRGNQSAYNVAFRDAYEGPVVSELRTDQYTGLPGQPLIVCATDDFRVTKVHFALLSANGAFMETGEALQDINGFDWVYFTQVNNRSLKGTIIRVTAIDIPLNRATLEVVME